MTTTRRTILKLSAIGAASLVLPGVALADDGEICWVDAVWHPGIGPWPAYGSLPAGLEHAIVDRLMQLDWYDERTWSSPQLREACAIANAHGVYGLNRRAGTSR